MQKVKSILLILLTLVLFTQTAAVLAAVPVYMDGDMLEDVPSVDIKQNSLFAPIRPIAEKMGATVEYDGRQVSINHDGVVIKLTLGSRQAVVQGTDGTAASYQLSAAPYLKNNRTMLPLRFVSEQLGCNVSYQGVCVKIILPGEIIGGQRAYTMALDSSSAITGRKHIVNNCIAMLAECKGQAIAKPDNIVPRSSWGEYLFYNRQSELIADWRFWVPEGVQNWPYGTLYLQDVLIDQYYEADESVFDYYFADNGKHLELEIAAFMGAKGVIYD